jgi:hypothetical protein
MVAFIRNDDPVDREPKESLPKKTTTTTTQTTRTVTPSNNTRTVPAAATPLPQPQASPQPQAAPAPQPAPPPPEPVVPAGLSKEYLKVNIKKLYGPNIQSADDAFNQWNASFTDYLKNANSNGFVPVTFGVNLATGFKASADSKTFIEDFDKNVESWVKGITWSDGKDSKACNVPGPLGFQVFSDAHKNDTDLNYYQDSLSGFLHDWFSKMTV